jgi:hypothetical protein
MRMGWGSYLRLAEAGAFTGFVKTELIAGEISVVNSVWSRHARARYVDC